MVSSMFHYLSFCSLPTEMGPYYASITSSALSPLPSNPQLLAKLQAANTATLEALDAKLEQAKATEGETDVSDTLKEKANFLTRIGEKEKAIEAQKLALEKTAGVGGRIDISLTLVRIGLFWADNDLIVWGLEKAEACVHSPLLYTLTEWNPG